MTFLLRSHAQHRTLHPDDAPYDNGPPDCDGNLLVEDTTPQLWEVVCYRPDCRFEMSMRNPNTMRPVAAGAREEMDW